MRPKVRIVSISVKVIVTLLTKLAQSCSFAKDSWQGLCLMQQLCLLPDQKKHTPMRVYACYIETQRTDHETNKQKKANSLNKTKFASVCRAGRQAGTAVARCRTNADAPLAQGSQYSFYYPLRCYKQRREVHR